MTHQGGWRSGPRAPCVKHFKALLAKDLKLAPYEGSFCCSKNDAAFYLFSFGRTPCQISLLPYGQFN